MDSFSGPGSTHPLVRAVVSLGAVLDESESVTPTGMSVAEKQAALVDLCRVVERAQGLKLTLMAAGEDVAAQDASRDIAAWLAPRVQADHGPVKALQHLAEATDRRWTRVGEAMRAGRCSVDQARVIVKALDDLPADKVAPELLAKAEETLVEDALHFPPKDLRRLGDRILELLAPDIHEDAEREKLEKEFQKARRTTRFNFKCRGDGTTDIYGKLPDSVAHRLRTYLDSFTTPRHQTSVSNSTGLGGVSHLDPATGERLPAERLRGQAFCAMLERIDPAQMPLHGGTPTSVNVTITLDALRAGLGVGTLADGSAIPVGEVRRLACTAGIIPLVLGGTSEVLDLGRTRRPFTEPRSGPWRTATPPAGPKAAPSRPTGARPTTSPNPGHTTAGPTSRTASCSATTTITRPTTLATKPASSPTATSGSPGEAEIRNMLTP